MKASIKNIEQTIASEQYRPALSEEYQELFQRLTRRLEDTLPMNRARIISDELRRVSETAREADLDCQKYMAALSVLVDLSLQGWIFDFQDHQLTLRMENDNIDDKEKIRYRLSAERNAQFKSESVARFIKYMETERNYNGTPVSVKCLIGNRDALILAIRTGRQVCAPYIQKSGETIRTLERFKTDIGIQLEANGEILIDHIKGTKYLSVDVPFAGAGKAISLLKHLNLLDGSSGALDFVAGQKADGRFEVVDIAKAPHMLIAGTTGSGKTIFLYSIIVSLLHKYPMEDLEFLIIDPKQTDFVFFEDLPNLYGGHVVVDAEEALEMIQRINDVDKEGRMQQLRFCRSRDIGSYNEKNPDHRMKRLIIIIDEYADLIQTAEMQGKRKEFEKFLSMLAQKVRSLGIHLIIATQRPSANIVTGVLKANIPYRISFRLPSHTDSQTILDMPGAENLLGKGDMLMVTDSDTIRMQGLYISEDELDNFVKSRQ